MTANHLTFRLLLCLYALSFGMVGCSTKVSVTTSGNPLFTSPVDLHSASVNYAKIKQKSASRAEIEEYNAEVRRAVTQLVRLNDRTVSTPKTLRTTDGDARFRLNHSSVRSYERIDRISLAKTIRVTGGIHETIECFGAGVPLAARMLPDRNDKLIPGKGVWIPLTAILEPNRKSPVIRLLDTTCSGCRMSFPVAKNFTAPLARDFHDRQKELQRTGALFNYDRFATGMGIKRIFGFHPHKTPVVFVHGIFSSSTTWVNAINKLMEDPGIRCHFEFWTFGYPTGAPIPWLAQKLREDIEEMHRFRAANRATRPEVIVIGHSMGGLMAKNLTQRSGDRQWNRFFEQSPGSLNVSEEEEEVLRKMFYFEPLPYVNRVIFTATPHNGAEAVDNSFVQLVEQFIRNPRIIVSATQNVLHQSAHALTPLGLDIHHDFPTSIEHMSRGSELGDIFSNIPLNKSVKYHSIIGSRDGLDVPKNEMSDGIVAWESAHIEGVVSEKIVESNHGVQHSAAGIAEIARILKSAR